MYIMGLHNDKTNVPQNLIVIMLQILSRANEQNTKQIDNNQ